MPTTAGPMLRKLCRIPTRLRSMRRRRTPRSPPLALSRPMSTTANSAFAPNDTERVFRSMSTAELLARYSLVSLSAVPGVVSLGRSVSETAVQRSADRGPVGWIARALVTALRSSLFKLYVAGEALDDCAEVSQRLAIHRMKMIVDHSTEEQETEEAWEGNLAAKRTLFGAVRRELGEGSVSFVPIKVTALCSPALLETMSSIIAQESDWESRSVDPSAQLSDTEADLLDRALANLDAICGYARHAGVGVLFDAEQSHRQPAIEHIALRLMRRYNKPGSAPIVYNTFQMYLRGAPERLGRDLVEAETGGFTMAVKLVRGAYIADEEARARAQGRPSPIAPSKAHTDKQYDQGVSLLLDSISRADAAGGAGGAAVIVATHNRNSVNSAIDAMQDLGIARDHPSVHFAQIMGLCDNLGHALGDAGYNANKLVLFGTFEEVFPWLLRRLDENRDVLGATAREGVLLRDEVIRRLTKHT